MNPASLAQDGHPRPGAIRAAARRVTTILLGAALAGGLESLAIAGGTACREPTVKQLILQLSAPDPRERLEAVVALGELGPAAVEAAPTLLAYIRSEPLRAGYNVQTDYGAIEAARESLVAMGLAVIPVLRDALDDPDASGELALVFAGLGSPAIPALVGILREPDDRGFRHATAADAIERMNNADPEVLGALVGALGAATAKEAGVRAALVRAIGSLGPGARSAVPVLVESLADSDRYVEAYAAEALGKVGATDADVVVALGGTVGKGREPAQAAALRTLRGLGSAALPALPALIRALESPNAYVVKTAVEAVSGIGPEAKAAAPGLRDLIERADAAGRGQLADAARRALEQIGVP